MQSRVRIRALLSTLLVACSLAPSAAFAWDRTGHLVVARIAWEELSSSARDNAAALLAAAPADADLASLLPATSRPLAARQAEHFQNAAYWPDLMRDGDFPERREAYHRGDWHYVNHFFEQRGPERTPHDRNDLESLGNLVNQLNALVPTLGDSALPAAERGVNLAWVLHLDGDVHQPLHATGRVTATEPQGDRGGNLFELNGRNNLHGLWDRILTSSNFKWFWQSDDSYIQRIAREIVAAHPKSSFGDRVNDKNYKGWALESFELAKQHGYPAELVRGERPPRSYARTVLEVSEERIALAGYRLAAVLEEQLGEPPASAGD